MERSLTFDSNKNLQILFGKYDQNLKTIEKELDVKIDEEILGEGGLPEMLKLSPILYAAESSTYYGVDGYIGNAYSLGKAIK